MIKTPVWLVLAILALSLLGFGASVDRRDTTGIILALYLMLKYGFLLWHMTQRKDAEKRMGRRR